MMLVIEGSTQFKGEVEGDLPNEHVNALPVPSHLTEKVPASRKVHAILRRERGPFVAGCWGLCLCWF